MFHFIKPQYRQKVVKVLELEGHYQHKLGLEYEEKERQVCLHGQEGESEQENLLGREWFSHLKMLV